MKISRRTVFCWIRQLLVLAVIVLGTFYSAFSQNSINGMVFDERRQPVSDVEVELLDEYYRRIQGIRIQNGTFVFSNLRAGNYYLKVRSNNPYYREKLEAIRDLGITNGVNSATNRVTGRDAIQVVLYLEPNRRDNPVGGNRIVFVQEIPDGAKKFFTDAVSNIDKSDLEQAIVNLKKAIEMFPTYYDALLLLGNQFVSQQKFEEAETVLVKASEVNPSGSGCFEGLGFVKYKLNKREEAVKILEKALQINAKSEDAYVWLGIIHRLSKNYQTAESVLKKGNEILEKKNANIHWQLALLYNDMKRYRESADELTTFLKLQPDSQDKEKIKKLIEQLRDKEKNGS